MLINEHTISELAFYFYSADSLSGLQSNFSATIEVINLPEIDKDWFCKGYTENSIDINKLHYSMLRKMDQISRLVQVRTKLLKLPTNHLTTIALAHDDSLPYEFRKIYTDSTLPKTPLMLAALVERTPTAIQEAAIHKITPRALCFTKRIQNPLNVHDRNIKDQIITEAKSNLIEALTVYESLVSPTKLKPKRKPKSKRISKESLELLINQLENL